MPAPGTTPRALLALLVAALLALAGLICSLVVRRRRVFVRVSPATAPGRTVVADGGLAKGDDDGLQDVVDRLVAALEARFDTQHAIDPDADPDAAQGDDQGDDQGAAQGDDPAPEPELDSRLDARG